MPLVDWLAWANDTRNSSSPRRCGKLDRKCSSYHAPGCAYTCLPAARLPKSVHLAEESSRKPIWDCSAMISDQWYQWSAAPPSAHLDSLLSVGKASCLPTRN